MYDIICYISYIIYHRLYIIHGAVLGVTGFEKCPSCFFNGNRAHYNLLLRNDKNENIWQSPLGVLAVT